MGTEVVTDDHLERVKENIRRRLSGSVRNLTLMLRGDGLVIRGCVRTYYSKQLAQHAVMEFTTVPIRANEIEVTWEDPATRPLPEDEGPTRVQEINQKVNGRRARSRRKA
jgi:hypothetical protein